MSLPSCSPTVTLTVALGSFMFFGYANGTGLSEVTVPSLPVTTTFSISSPPLIAPSTLNHCVTPAPAGMSTATFLLLVTLPVERAIVLTSTVPLKGFGESFLT